LTNRFYSVTLFDFAIVFFVFPNLIFLRAVITDIGRPTFRFLEVEDIKDQRKMILDIFVSKENSVSFVRFITSMITNAIALIVHAMLLFLIVMGNIVFLSALFIFGIFLFQTKLWSIKWIWVLWLKLWRPTMHVDGIPNIDAEKLNQSLAAEFFLETLPQVHSLLYIYIDK
jgi:DNA segregation ATPase FtsK/SpoIIIE-like protein